ncbi:MAG: DivIVA domain-containing protein [Actinomycetota bacterium]|nr:DivIVA domain-containing protein [Actinomycetota bacterium]
MSINSEIIQKKEFHVVFKGYKPEEVDKFLDILAVEFEKLQRTNRELQESLDRIKYEEGKESAEMKKVIQEAIVSAHKIAEDIKMKAEREAEEIVRTKVAEEENSYKKLLSKKMQLEREIEELEKEYKSFTGKIAKLVDDFKKATSGLEEEKFIHVSSSTIEEEVAPEEEPERFVAEPEAIEKGKEEPGGKNKEEELNYSGDNRLLNPGNKKEVVEEEEREIDVLLESRPGKHIGNEEEFPKEELERGKGFEKIKFEGLSGSEESGEEYLKKSKFREYFDEEEYNIGQEEEEEKEQDQEETEEKPRRGIYDDYEEEEPEDYYKPKRMKKKIDIANPDIINDFFKTDED